MIIGKGYASGTEVPFCRRCKAMKTNRDGSSSAHDSAKGSPYFLSRVNVLRGYIYPSDYSVAITFGWVGLGGGTK